MPRGDFIASVTADLVIALKTTRLTSVSLPMARRLRSASSRCQLIASPSRSGSVARMRRLSFFSASAMALTWRRASVSTSHFMAKPFSGSTEPSFGGRSRTWP